MHLWLRLPEGCSDADVTEAAAARGVAVNAGRASFPSEPPDPYLRLSYAAEEPPGAAPRHRDPRRHHRLTSVLVPSSRLFLSVTAGGQMASEPARPDRAGARPGSCCTMGP